MTLSHLFDNLDEAAAESLGVPVQEFKDVIHAISPDRMLRMSLVVEAALSVDPRDVFRAQKIYRIIRCVFKPSLYKCPCS